MNVHSLIPKINNFIVTCSELDVDIAVVTETWLQGSGKRKEIRR